MAFTEHPPSKEVTTLSQTVVVTNTPSAVITDVTTKLLEGQVHISKTTTVLKGSWLMFLGQNKKKLQVQVKATVAFLQSEFADLLSIL
jgi:hypothetical protein